jgi:hypothetical protein
MAELLDLDPERVRLWLFAAAYTSRCSTNPCAHWRGGSHPEAAASLGMSMAVRRSGRQSLTGAQG